MACRVSWFAGMVALCGLAGGMSRADVARSLGDLTGPWQLFVDDHLIAAKEKVTRRYHPFEKHADRPVLVGDRPWEGNDIYLYGTVLPAENGKGYRMWYQTIPRKGERVSVLYATSPDGIRWEKPDLGIVSRNGSTANNMLFSGDKGSFMASVMHAPWDPDARRQYRAMRLGEGGYNAAYSADGIHFEDLPGNPVCKGGGDSGQFSWDAHTGQYLGFAKVIYHVDGLRRRCVGGTATKDFAAWPEFRPVLTPDTFDDRWVPPGTTARTHFYGVSAFAYESMYIGLLWVYRAVSDEGYFLGTIHVELVTSRDGIHWLREEGDRPPILALGAPGTWDDSMIFTPNHPLVEGDRIRLYYAGFDEEHDRAMNGRIGLAFLRKDGFASLDAGDVAGTVLTKRLRGAKGPLRVNADAKGGWLKVEAQDADGRALPGYAIDDCRAITGDGVDQVVSWRDRNELPAADGPVRLRFVLQKASLYSFMAGERVQIVEEPAKPALAALYTFEGDGGRKARDRLTADGAQEAAFVGGLKIKGGPDVAAFGKAGVEIGSEFCAYNAIEIKGTSRLGTRFTLACMARSEGARPARLLSSFDGCGPIRYADLVFDYDPGAKLLAGLRLVCKGIVTESRPLRLDDGKYHHLAVTYDDGAITFYADGKEIGGGFVPGGEPVALRHNLFAGDDARLGADAHFVGAMDDILVLGRVLTAKEIGALAVGGAEKALRTETGRGR
mgnify:CR=1 FL=1